MCDSRTPHASCPATDTQHLYRRLGSVKSAACLSSPPPATAETFQPQPRARLGFGRAGKRAEWHREEESKGWTGDGSVHRPWTANEHPICLLASCQRCPGSPTVFCLRFPPAHGHIPHAGRAHGQSGAQGTGLCYCLRCGNCRRRRIFPCCMRILMLKIKFLLWARDTRLPQVILWKKIN